MAYRVAEGMQGSLAAQLSAREDRDLFRAVDPTRFPCKPSRSHRRDMPALMGTTDGRETLMTSTLGKKNARLGRA